jgi:hypothetical protein
MAVSNDTLEEVRDLYVPLLREEANAILISVIYRDTQGHRIDTLSGVFVGGNIAPPATTKRSATAEASDTVTPIHPYTTTTAASVAPLPLP